jgi:hypothetical protein
VIQCPNCDNHTLSWDNRVKRNVCLSNGCSYYSDQDYARPWRYDCGSLISVNGEVVAFGLNEKSAKIILDSVNQETHDEDLFDQSYRS